MLSNQNPEDVELTKRYFNRFLNHPLTIHTHSTSKFIMDEGLPQGDPLSPLLFALTLQPVLVKTQEKMLEEHAVQQLQQLPSKQLTLLLLRHCINQYSGYMTRTSPPSINNQAAQIHDNLVKETLATILELDMNDIDNNMTDEYRLPLTMGGLGLPSAQ